MKTFQIDNSLFGVTGMDLLLLKNISYDAGGKRVIDGLDLAMAKQEVHALLGTNGTGKNINGVEACNVANYRLC